MKKTLLDLLICPRCRGPLTLDRGAGELVCQAESVAYPVVDGIPMVLPEQARPLAPTVVP